VTTRLKNPLRREVLVGRTPYTLTVDGAGLKLTEKGHRRGILLSWKAVVSGDAALAIALQASMDRKRDL